MTAKKEELVRTSQAAAADGSRRDSTRLPDTPRKQTLCSKPLSTP